MHKTLLVMALGGAAWSANLFPLRTGNTWTYREATTGSAFTVRVGTPVISNDRVYYSVSGYLSNRALLRIDAKGNLVYLSNDDGQEHVLTSFTPFEQGRWEAPLRPCPEQLGKTLEKRATVDGPAGHFEDALQIQYDTIGCADVGVQSELYADGVGMLQRTVGTIAGPRTYDLVHARVGSMELEAGPVGKFSVSVTQSGPLSLTLRLRVDPPTPLTLQFNSGQEYDATIEDASGKVVWRWSDGQAFPQVLHEKTISGEWTIDIPIGATQLPRAVAESQRRVRSQAALAPGHYKVHAWLTTAGGVPAYSATGVFTLK